MKEKNICYSRGCSLLKEGKEITYSFFPTFLKLDVYNYFENLPISPFIPSLVEVRFKNTRKDIFQNFDKIPLLKGDVVVVEAQTGHDVGIVNAIGEVVYEQLRTEGINPQEIQKRVYRKAKPVDLEKWYQAISLEYSTMLKSRQIAKSLGLEMKISDVEYQGDKSKAIFYYIADERVDFRELIKKLATEFRVKIEMRQIGVRQEAGRVGGIGSCGREICCSTWKSDFASVSTTAIHLQELAPNLQKLTGQCGKLKCCLNYELDIYLDARKYFPDSYDVLEVMDGNLYCQKIDVFRAMFWYSRTKDSMFNLIALSLEQVNSIIHQNQKGIKPNITDFVAKETAKNESTIDFTSELNSEDDGDFKQKNKNKKNRKKFVNKK